MELKVISKIIAVPAANLSPRAFAPTPFMAHEVVSEIRVKLGHNTLVARSVNHSIEIEHLPLEVIERELQDQICREIGKRLFGN